MKTHGVLLLLLGLMACSTRPEYRGETTSASSESIDIPRIPPQDQPEVDAELEPAEPTVNTPDTPAAVGTGPATGSVAVAFTPVRYQAAQYPAFVYAVWITDANNKYLKTISARAAARMRYLDKWLAAAGVVLPTQPDGVAGASLTYPAAATAITVNWDLKDKVGAVVPQGNYTINIQLTSSNNTGLSLAIPLSVTATGATKTDTTMATGITTVSVKHVP